MAASVLSFFGGTIGRDEGLPVGGVEMGDQLEPESASLTSSAIGGPFIVSGIGNARLRFERDQHRPCWSQQRTATVGFS